MEHHNKLDPASRPLRILTILAWLPAMSLSIPFSVNNESLLPALGLVPMTFSAMTGMSQLSARRSASSRGVCMFMDVFCACFLFAVFIPSCTALAGSGRAMMADQTVLGTLGAAPMMLNL